MGKLYVLIGRSAVGKSTIEKMLHQRGMKRIVSCTTRLPRENEIDGVDYHFITELEFQARLKAGNFAEYSTYNGWNYAVSKEDISLKHLENEDYICVLEKKGYRDLVEYLGKDNVVGCYLYLQDTWELLKRAIDRQPHCSNSACIEICRRFLADEEDFKSIEKECILRINNIDTVETVSIIERFIKTNK